MLILKNLMLILVLNDNIFGGAKFWETIDAI